MNITARQLDRRLLKVAGIAGAGVAGASAIATLDPTPVRADSKPRRSIIGS